MDDMATYFNILELNLEIYVGQLVDRLLLYPLEHRVQYTFTDVERLLYAFEFADILGFLISHLSQCLALTSRLTSRAG